ncbi:NmrA family NAD(P)-binding protein [Mycobacterium sp. 852002-51961_SCH5331710]|uniref:NmrA family NAD(P)-binding protein n=1 Tax=Mycobacterium sp. 852002-51961_SCH5331710 TaxID=1834105 RepID=UPI0007FFFD41|nr:NmrA family NAD(P)-binding protein [Mycobacterium sp. 852002-51961_SCH5331710]OBB35932.1 NmrA family transcriptional regulator [Mycobacterium sp. 852002-51961_SCH5331710]
MSDNPILVTGATGRHGNTGEHLVRRLRDEGHAVRVLVRTLSERTDRLAGLGAEVVVGDLHDRRSLLPALTDVDLAYFMYPIDAGVVAAAANYAAAVREVGRRPRTVVMSMGPAHPDNPSDLGRAQWLAEQILEWAGLDLVILRVAALFHENLAVLHSDSVREHGLIRNSFGDNAVAWISGSDAAELGLMALVHPDRFPEPVYYVKGSEVFSHAHIAAALEDMTGRPIRYEAVTRDEWRSDLERLAESAYVVNPAMAQHISAVGHMVATSGRTLPADRRALGELIGREPITLREFLNDNLEAFAAPERRPA